MNRSGARLTQKLLAQKLLVQKLRVMLVDDEGLAAEPGLDRIRRQQRADVADDRLARLPASRGAHP